MAWDRLGGDGDEYSGDVPMDAFAGAVRAASMAFEQAAGRKPYASELAEAMARALAGRADTDRLLARWLAMPRIGGTKRPRVASGDIVRIPYAGDGARQIYARVLFAPPRTRKQPRQGPGLGPLWVVHDLDAPTTGELDPAVVRSAPLLMGPVHGDDELVREGRWRIVGRIEPDDAELPTLGERGAVTDYFGGELPSTPENEARLVMRSRENGQGFPIVIRMLRGCLRRVPAYVGKAYRAKP